MELVVADPCRDEVVARSGELASTGPTTTFCAARRPTDPAVTTSGGMGRAVA
jgi:hypothetical protein